MSRRKEVWKDIIHYKNRYQVSNKGRIKSLKRLADPIYVNGNVVRIKLRERIMKLSIVGGYVKVCLNKKGVEKSVSVHRLVAIAFKPNPRKLPQVNHKDGNKQNNNDWNLEWATSKENARHAFDTGLKSAKKGANSNFAKLDETQVKTIRSLASERKIRMKDIAAYFKINPDYVRYLERRVTWKHI